MDNELVLAMVKVGIAALLMFTALLVWGRTREPSWVFLVIGIIFYFLQTVVRVLESLKLLSISTGDGSIDLIIQILVDNLAFVFLAIGCLVAFRKL